MEEDECSEQDVPKGGGTIESDNDGGDGESFQILEFSEESRRKFCQNARKPRYTKQPAAKQIRIPRSGARRMSEATTGREVEPMDPNGRSKPRQTLQEVNAISNEI